MVDEGKIRVMGQEDIKHAVTVEDAVSQFVETLNPAEAAEWLRHHQGEIGEFIRQVTEKFQPGDSAGLGYISILVRHLVAQAAN